MRDLLRALPAGGTVLLSSHLLHEIEVIADDLVVIGNGKIVARAARKSCSRSGHPRPANLVQRCELAVTKAGLTFTDNVGSDVLINVEGERRAGQPRLDGRPGRAPRSSGRPKAQASRPCSSISPQTTHDRRQRIYRNQLR